MQETLFGSERPRSFTETSVKDRLAHLSPRGRAVFAWSCSARLLPGYLKWHDEVGTLPASFVKDMLVRIGEQLRNAPEDQTFHELDSEVDTLLELMPTENSAWSPSHPIAEDAVASLAYTLRSMATGDPQESAWAARRAYEAADQLAILDLAREGSELPDERRLLIHSAVQKELARQEYDFGLISQGNIIAIIDSASMRSIFDYQQVPGSDP
jgi:uncharacterized protein YjaG (DUF416 family)